MRKQIENDVVYGSPSQPFHLRYKKTIACKWVVWRQEIEERLGQAGDLAQYHDNFFLRSGNSLYSLRDVSKIQHSLKSRVKKLIFTLDIRPNFYGKNLKSRVKISFFTLDLRLCCIFLETSRREQKLLPDLKKNLSWY